MQKIKAGGEKVMKYENELRRFSSISLSTIVVKPKKTTEVRAYKNQISNVRPTEA